MFYNVFTEQSVTLKLIKVGFVAGFGGGERRRNTQRQN